MVATSSENLFRDEADVWDSGKIVSNQSVHVAYGGPPLQSRQRYFWKVRIWDGQDRPSPWSDIHWWEMGLLRPEDWSAQWIGMREEAVPPPCPYLRKSFEVGKAVRRARLYATALGVYELHLNGDRVGTDLLAPGWTDYSRRVLYQTYDVTGQILDGENVLGAVLGVGWYAGPLTWELKRNCFGESPPRLLVQLEIEFEDGTTQRIVSDGSWRGATGPIRYSEIYEGELYDARLEMPGWDARDFDDSAWRPVDLFDPPKIHHDAQMMPAIRITEEVRPVSVHEPAPGVNVFDLGQNIVGCCRLRVRGPAGTEVRLRHAEVLRPDGSLDTENLRKAAATDIYILKGEGEEVFVPHFTYHGFRYVEVTGYPGQPDLNAITGLVFHTDAPIKGTFACSSDMVNRLYQNTLWSQRANMFSVLTDCPQRDERLGWTGDAQIFAPTACFNMDIAAFLTKCVQDMVDAQTPEGAFPDIAPYVDVEAIPPQGAPGWADAGIIVPWTLYQQYGDRRVLERTFDAMARYVDYVTQRNPDGLWVNDRGNDYGDWVPAGSDTDKVQFATLYFFYSAQLVARIAGILGRKAEAIRYQQIADRVRQAFNDRYLEGGRYQNATQTLNAMALGFGIVPDEARPSVAEDLVRDIESRGWHLSTGFHGTKWLLPVLSEMEYDDVALRLLLNRDYPSWGYMISKGATTIWERWDSDVAAPDMNSHNHFAFGSVAEWLFRYLAGIDVADDGPGFQHAILRPRPPMPGSELNWVRATYESLYGRITSEWRLEPGAFHWFVQLPANTRATIYLPAESIDSAEEGGVPLTAAEGVRNVRLEDGRVVVDAGAGAYRFVVRPVLNSITL
jgi:alpha-L-rhamnosidase